MTPMSSVRSKWGSRPCQDPCWEEMWLNYSCHCIFRPSAEQALQLLHGTFFGGQSVSLSWGRSPLNKQTQASSWVIVVTLPPSHLHPPSISSMETWNLSSFCQTKNGVTCASYTISKHMKTCMLSSQVEHLHAPSQSVREKTKACVPIRIFLFYQWAPYLSKLCLSLFL
ncbi:uncharacterized protein [Triticum aestivum]|uniref:uncharacterized protein n=1 Tax=Triticum aestivum TaxID=4565 RepID=UPI001D004CAA|nr:uncharacterized protein LOC123076260 [Triticum aestivum]